VGILDARDPAGRLVWPWPAALGVLAVAVQRGAGLAIGTTLAHAVAAIVLWAVVRRGATRYGTALVAGTLFAVHPVLVERVTAPIALSAYAGAAVASAAVAVAIAAIGTRGSNGARAAVITTVIAAAALAAWTITLGR